MTHGNTTFSADKEHPHNTPRFLLLDSEDRFAYHLADHQPLLLSDVPAEVATTGPRVRLAPGLYAQRSTPGTLEHLVSTNPLLAISTLREWASHPLVSKAAVLLKHRETTLFDPRDGSSLSFDDSGIIARGQEGTGQPIFPRIDPAVIGLVECPSEKRILLARNRHRGRNHYFSLIAGYVDPGENLEDAMTREIAEETAYHASIVRYLGSQSWAPGGSIMMGFYCHVTDTQPRGEGDGELAEIRWLSRQELSSVALPGKGSIARRIIDSWWFGGLAEGGEIFAPHITADPAPHTAQHHSTTAPQHDHQQQHPPGGRGQQDK